MALPGDYIKEFVHCIKDGDVQIQPAGVDLTVWKVFSFESHASIGFSKRKLAEVVEIPPTEGAWFLKPGVYKVVFNEIVKVPDDAVGLCFPRSSLLRSGILFACTVWDPGYVGRGEGMLAVFNPYGLELEVNARVAQLIFIRLIEKPSKVYGGIYKGENL